jgi:hypothetical protein
MSCGLNGCIAARNAVKIGGDDDLAGTISNSVESVSTQDDSRPETERGPVGATS